LNFMPDNLSPAKSNLTDAPGYCEICAGPPPPGHRFCDNCWPDAALAKGLAVRCAICNTPKVVAKLHSDAQGRLVCREHIQD